MSNAELFINGMHGLGDNIYMRAFVRQFPGAYVATPWPELYSDLDVRCVRPLTTLRTQVKNLKRTDYEWHPAPKIVKRAIQVRYRGPILEAMSALFGVSPVFDLPDFPTPLVSDKPIALIRPPTVRKEWPNPARNPKGEYIAQAARMLRRRGYFVVSVADIEPGQEWLDGPLPEADVYIHDGRLSVAELLGLFRYARVAVGGVGWIVPASLATRTPLYCVLGGNGGYNAPEIIASRDYVNADHIEFAEPTLFCRCRDNLHNCKKDIHGFAPNFSRWLDRIAADDAGQEPPRLVA